MMMELVSMAAEVAAPAAAGHRRQRDRRSRRSRCGLGVGLIGAKAAEAVGRNPGAFGNILTMSIIGMALAEGLGIIAFFAVK